MKKNRLAGEKSPYLRHAADQPIDWYPWCEEAFEAASREGKPIFLSSGAAWCHWCHVMAQESFVNTEIADIINENFIAIKLDRDERPDIDRRYQQAAAASGVGGGWPLTAFLTPDRKPFYIGTYFPPKDAFGRPSFETVLLTILNLYKSKRGDVDEYAEKITDAIKSREIPPGTIQESLLDEAAGLILSEFDSKNGGFQKAPKFPMAGSLDFLMQRYALTGHGVIGHAVRKTLESMSRGGFYDQLAGGFHRYSVDESWCIPHFEKMANDNAWLLRNYIDAYALFGDEHFRKVAEGIIGFATHVLGDPEGGFYASQDADVIPDDEGGYFTWTEEQVREALDQEEYRVLSLHFLHRCGAMHHDPSKMVLLTSMTDSEIAQRLAMTDEDVKRVVETGKEKLLARRREREEPFIDKTLYTSLNGMFITAFLKAFRVLGDKQIEDFALKSLSRIRRERLIDDELFHSEGVKALLDDYVSLIEALVEAYEVTGGKAYLDLSRHLMERVIERFWDERTGGFFESEEELLGTRLKSVEDVPHPSANSIAIMLLVKLSSILQIDRYKDYARRSLEAFVPLSRQFGVHAGYFFSALDSYYHILRLDFEALPGSDLVKTGIGQVKPYTAVGYGPGIGRVIPCFGSTCFEPIDSANELQRFLLTKPYLTKQS
jgi:hypothetical protein